MANCLRDGTPLGSAIDPRQPELFYRCPQCGTRYDHVLNMLPEPRAVAAQERPPVRVQRGLGMPYPSGRVEQIGRLVWLVLIILVCASLLLVASWHK